jgi:hypothetical protein
MSFILDFYRPDNKEDGNVLVVFVVCGPKK